MNLVAITLALLLPVQTPDARLAGASREDKAGWSIVHLKGSPKEVGYQYGSLMAAEIKDAHEALRAVLKMNTRKDWSYFRDVAKDVFWPKVPEEYRAEMEGQVEGLNAKGVDYDIWDVVAFNSYIEIEGYYMPYERRKQTGIRTSSTKESCSAFIATGSATKDGKIVMGHNLWWDYTIGQRFKTILDIQPAKGNRVKMDVLTGFIHSGSDFAVNSAGIVMCETTISGFHGFDPAGTPEFVRMRQAMQYGNSLDDVRRIFEKGNNGGYANTWLIGDTKTGEIGKLELGLKNVDFQRTKDGYFVGANFPESPKLIAEEVVGFNADPLQNSCLRRKVRWNSLLTSHKGKVDAENAKTFLADTYDEVLDRKGASGSTLCGRSDYEGYPAGAVNTKVVTTDLAKNMEFWAKMGFSDNSTFDAPAYMAKNTWLSALKPYLKSIPAQPYILAK